MGCDPMLMLVLVLDSDRVRVEFPNPKAASTIAFSFHVRASSVLSHEPRVRSRLAREHHWTMNITDLLPTVLSQYIYIWWYVIWIDMIYDDIQWYNQLQNVTISSNRLAKFFTFPRSSTMTNCWQLEANSNWTHGTCACFYTSSETQVNYDFCG
jgi:hypothetical protein